MRKWAMLPALVVAAVLMASSSVSAAGPPLSDENNRIWAQYTNQPSCCTTFGSTLDEDPLFSGSGNFGTSRILPAGTATSFVLDYALTAQEFATQIELDPAGTVDFTVNIGALENPLGPSAGVARVQVDVELLLGDVSVASGSGEEVVDHFNDGFKTVTYSVAPTQTTLDPADGVLQWKITVTGLASGVYVSHTAANGDSWVELPIKAGSGGTQAPAVTYEDLAEATSTRTFAEATDAVEQLNFTNFMDNGTVTFDWNATGGSVAAVLADANGTAVYNGTFEGNGTLSHDFTGLETGNWTLSLDYTNFTGDFAFSVHETMAGEGGAGGEHGTGGSGTDGAGGSGGEDHGDHDDHGDEGSEGSGNETTQDTGGDDKESPVVPTVLLVLGLMFVAFRRRF